MIVGAAFYDIVQGLNILPVSRSKFVINGMPLVFFLFVFFRPYYTILKKSLEEGFGYFMIEDKDISAYLDDGLMDRKNINGQMVCWNEYKGNVTWYLKALALEGKNVKRIDTAHIRPGQIIITFQPDVKEFISSHYNVSVKENYRQSITVFHILQ